GNPPISPRKNNSIARSRHYAGARVTRNIRKCPQENSEAGTDEPEDVRPSKHLQGLSPSKDQLSEQNLRLFNGEDRGPLANHAWSPNIERQIIRRSWNTIAFYRYEHLADANVYLHIDPPDDVRTAINSIVEAEVPKDRPARFRDIVKELYEGCKKEPNNFFFHTKADWREELKPTIQHSDWDLSFFAGFNAMGDDQQEDAGDASDPPPPERQ
ncbi:hypothetical protein MMC29_008377, partial [Sticta canariensis]|nr:hypothetical protein [Sticta canariensis]